MSRFDISAVHENFCTKFYTIVTLRNIHFTVKFGWNTLENDKIMLPNVDDITPHVWEKQTDF